MDLVAGSKRVIATVERCAKTGSSQTLRRCTLPLTAAHEVDYIVTEVCVLHDNGKGWMLEKLAPSVAVEKVLAKTEAELIVPDEIRWMV